MGRSQTYLRPVGHQSGASRNGAFGHDAGQMAVIHNRSPCRQPKKSRTGGKSHVPPTRFERICVVGRILGSCLDFTLRHVPLMAFLFGRNGHKMLAPYPGFFARLEKIQVRGQKTALRQDKTRQATAVFSGHVPDLS